MLNEYKNSGIWKNNPDEIKLRSDILVTKRAIDLLENISGKKILDAGCGNGKVSRLLAERGASVFGVDKIEDQIAVAKSLDLKLNIKYFVGDVTNLDILPNDFDIAVSLMTFLYLNEENFIEAAKQIRGHLKNGGRFKKEVFRYGFLSTLALVVHQFSLFSLREPCVVDRYCFVRRFYTPKPQDFAIHFRSLKKPRDQMSVIMRSK